MENTPPSYSSPPPPTPPPFIPVAQPAPRPRKSRGWMVFALILLVLLAFSVLLNIGSFFERMLNIDALPMAGESHGPRLDEVRLESASSPDKIVVIPIEGIIMGNGFSGGGHGMVDIVKAQFKRAEKDRHVKAVVLRVDSPGGEVMASDDIAKIIEEFQKDTGKPVVVSMGRLAASGGYYVSAPCSYIVANELTITGSIGVIMSSWNYRGLMNKVGVQPYTFKTGKFKDMMSGDREPSDVTDEEKEMLQKHINGVFDRFKTVVSEGRRKANQKNTTKGRDLAANWTEYADGRILSGKEAYELGFVDELGDFEHAVKVTEGIAGIPKANLVTYRARVDFADLFGILGKSEPPTIKLDLGVDLPKVEAGRVYLLSPVYLR